MFGQRERWNSWAKSAPSKIVAANKPRALVKRDSREGRAVAALYAIARAPAPLSADDQYDFKGELTRRMLSLADAPPPREWMLIEDQRQVEAWSEFVRASIGKPGSLSGTIVGQRFVGAGDQRVFAGNDLRSGLKAPWPWPPRKDGTFGPPPKS